MLDDELSVNLKATNSSTDLTLSIQKNKSATFGDDYSLTLWGDYRGDKRFQVDFDGMTRLEFEELYVSIGLILES